MVGIEDSAVRAYHQYYGNINPWFLNRADTFCEGSVLPATAAMPETDYRRTEFYNDWGRRNGVFHSVGANLIQDHNGIAHLNLQRTEHQREFGAKETQILRILMPHLQRAIRLYERLMVLEANRLAIDHWEVATFIVRGDALVIRMNAAGERLLAAGDGLRLRGGRLTAAMAPDTVSVLRLIAEAADARNSGLKMSGHCTLRRKSAKCPLAAFVSPATPKLSLPLCTGLALMFVVDPESRGAAPAEMVARIFGLTGAEARLATLLGAGMTLQDAGERLGVTRNTVKSQLASIFSKTGISRQGELIRLLARLQQVKRP